jgi:hypothetical protein
MRCESCGKDLPEDAAFCPDCGERTPAMSAGEIVDLAHTGGLVRGRAAGQVPEMPEDPELPDEVPELPEAAPLPDAPGMEIPGGEAASADIATGFLDKARLREEKRRAAQALVETAQTELREELSELADEESLIRARGYDLEEVYPTEKPPPPPPEETVEQRMWAETEERAERHGVEVPGAEDDRRIGEKLEDTVDEGGWNCLAYGCVALFALMFIFFIIGFIVNVAQ